MRSWTTLMVRCLLAAHSLFTANAVATCPGVSIRTRKTVVSNHMMLVTVKMDNPNLMQPLSGAALSVTLPAKVLYVRSFGAGAKHAAPTQNMQVLSWSNLYLKHTLSFKIKVKVTDCAYNAAGIPIVFTAQSSLGTLCTTESAPKSVTVKQSKTIAKAQCATPNPATMPPTTAPSPSQLLRVEYTFDNTLDDIAGGSALTVVGSCPGEPCNVATSFGSDAEGTFWAWSSTSPRGGGFTVRTNQLVGPTFTMMLKVAFAKTGSGYKKIIDFQDRASDQGLYFYSSQLTFYNFGIFQGSFADNQVVTLFLVRQSSGDVSNPSAGQFTVYSRVSANDLQPILVDVSDLIGASIPVTTGASQSLLGFFFDDTTTPDEATQAGRVYDLHVWGGVALTQQEIVALPF